MTRLLERFSRSLMAMRVLSWAVFSGLTLWFTLVTWNHRLPGRYFVMNVLGAGLFALSLLIFAQRLATATPPGIVRPLVEHADTFALLIALNLIIVNFLAPVVQMLSLLPWRNPLVQGAFATAGRLSSRLLLVLFIVGVVGFVGAIVARALKRFVLPEDDPARQLLRRLHRLAIIAVVLYCLWGLALTYNAYFDRSPVVEHRSEIVRVFSLVPPLGLPRLGWIDIRSWRTPNGIERVRLLPERDGLWPGAVATGQPLLVRTRSGFFGIQWIDSVVLDVNRQLPQLVEAVPTAALPRKWLISSLVHERRWQEAIAQTHEYLRYYPNDREIVQTVVGWLRSAGQLEDARTLEHLGASSAQPKRKS